MCGRTAQTLASVRFAAATVCPNSSDSLSAATLDRSNQGDNAPDDVPPVYRDNFNLSPGMDAIVFWKEGGQVQWGRKVWGLVPRGGSATVPLPQGMGKHFDNLMFNARSDTLFQKPTFGALAANGKSCVIAVDGFFEWKTEMGKKQPYFVYRKRVTHQEHRPYLLFAGLWTSVATGWPEQPSLDTFTIVTTEVCAPLQWLHSRMPVTIWDDALAEEWLNRPTPTVFRQLEVGAQQTADHVFQWHAVTPDMASMKFRAADAIKALPKMKTVKSFFAASPTKSTVKNKNEKNDKNVKNKPSSSRDTSSTSNTTGSSPSLLKTATSTDTSNASGSAARTGSITSHTHSTAPSLKRPAATDPIKSPATNQLKRTKPSPSRSIDTFFQPKAKK
jgi:putative SOS response-associated peptidase YedK